MNEMHINKHMNINMNNYRGCSMECEYIDNIYIL